VKDFKKNLSQIAMNKKYLLLLPILLILFSFKADKPAYKLFNQNGKNVKYKKLLKEAQEADIVFFGEYHNNPICHWLQIELTQDLYALKNSNLVLGAEMIEANDQALVDQYLNGDLDTKTFEDTAGLWKNYKTDYKPLVEFAKANNLKFVASNIPRPYASLVNKKGFEALEALSSEEKAFIAPLPIKYDPELPGYKGMIEMMKGMPHVTDNIARAQAMKDATMAHFILENWTKGQTFIHYNGSYHSNNFEGIIWYLQQANPNLKILTISAVEQKVINKLKEENKNIANFILAIPKTMTKTY
jgi:uncharacterized iron-regulated protein